MTTLTLSILPDTLAICRLDAHTAIPDWAHAGDFFSITRTQDELSIVCRQCDVPDGIKCDRGWRCLKVEGSLDFALTGILASLAVPLADAGVPVFVVSTFDTDCMLVKADTLQRATAVLRRAGHTVKETPK